MYEHPSQPLLPKRHFYKRLLGHAVVAFSITVCSLSIGILGYHFTERFSWIDSLLNASMILGGMGPVDTVRTVSGKVFASFYALFSGVVFLVTVGILLVPVVHRFLHRMHLDPRAHPESRKADQD